MSVKSHEVAPVVSDSLRHYDYSPPGSSLCGILQGRILSGLLLLSPGDLPDPDIKFISLMSPALAGRFLSTTATWKSGCVHVCSSCCMCSYVYIYFRTKKSWCLCSGLFQRWKTNYLYWKKLICYPGRLETPGTIITDLLHVYPVVFRQGRLLGGGDTLAQTGLKWKMMNLSWHFLILTSARCVGRVICGWQLYTWTLGWDQD